MAEDLDQDMEEEFMDDYENYGDHGEVEVVTAILKSASKSANDLTKLIVENNNRSNVTMSSDDIYDIYRNSFIVALTTISPSSE